MWPNFYTLLAGPKLTIIIPVQIQRFIVLLSLTLVLILGKSFAQQKDSARFKLSGYIDVYYAGYADSVGENNFHKFPAISPKSNLFSLNVFQLTAQYTAKKLRGTVTLHHGDFVKAAWSTSLNFIQEANLGVKLSKKFWLDAGLFKTHIGTEAFLPRDNITSSISILTFYEPFFQAGIKLSYIPNDKMTVCLHVLQGYNVFKDNNKKKAAGISFSYALGTKGSIGYNNLLGDETPDSIHLSHFRFLNNLFLNYQLTPKLKVLIGGDLVTQQHSVITDSTKTAFEYGGIATLKYQLKPKLGIYARGEIFSDANGFVTGTINDATNKITGFKLWGITAGLEYKPEENAFIRLEGRQLQMDKNQEIFRWKGKDISKRLELMVHAGVTF